MFAGLANFTHAQHTRSHTAPQPTHTFAYGTTANTHVRIRSHTTANTQVRIRSHTTANTHVRIRWHTTANTHVRIYGTTANSRQPRSAPNTTMEHGACSYNLVPAIAHVSHTSDIVPIRSWTRTLRRPGIRHRHLHHTIPYHLPYHTIHTAIAKETHVPTATAPDTGAELN